ncbi:MAG: hypothetical protein AAFO93_16095, partial [Pseudomonadota bacterium]
MNVNLETQTFEDVSMPNHSLPSDFNIIREETEVGDFYYREVTLSHIVIEISVLVPDPLRPSVPLTRTTAF